MGRSLKSHAAGARGVEADLLDLVRDEINAYTEAMLTRLNEEISRYPRPIARCDEQLTALLEQRAEIVRLVENMDDPARAFACIEQFLDSPLYAGDEAELALRSRLKEKLSLPKA